MLFKINKVGIVVAFIFITLTSIIAYREYLKEIHELKNLESALTLLQSQNTPIWIEKQINSDLNYFVKSGISQEILEHTSNYPDNLDRSMLLRFQIINGKIYAEDLQGKSRTTKIQYNEWLRFFKRLTQLTSLPNVDFIVSTASQVEYNLTSPVAPILTYSKDLNQSNSKYYILVPDIYALKDWNWLLKFHMKENISWDDKLNKAFWCGSEKKDKSGKALSRRKLVELSARYPELLDACFVYYPNIKSKDNRPKYPPHSRVKLKDHLRYKILISVDSISTARPWLIWRLLSRSVVIKQESSEISWFSRLLKAWIHYIPTNNNLEDIIERINWVLKNEESAQKIAQESKLLIEKNLTLPHLYLYWSKTLEKYAALQTFKLEQPSFPEAQFVSQY